MIYLLVLFLVVCHDAEGYSPPDLTRDLTSLFDGELYESVLDSELCGQQLSQMSSLPFYDASFRIPQGLLQGNFINYGNYEQCLSISQETESAGTVEGKMCMIGLPLAQESIINWPLNGYLTEDNYNETITKFYEYEKDVIKLRRDEEMFRSSEDGAEFLSLRLALCIPKTCTAEQVLDTYINNQLINVTYNVEYCRLPNDKPWVAADYIAIVIFSLIGVATMLSTSYELYHIFFLKKDAKELNKLYACGSVYSNTRRLFTFAAARPGSLGALDGLRSLSILWVVIGHTMIAITLVGFSNFSVALDWFLSIPALWLSAANISVDTFFMMSGLLLVYTNCNKMSQKTLVKNLHLYYLYRLLRLFPILASGVLFFPGLLHRIQDGVNWHTIAYSIQDCRQYWWSTLLHVQNYVNPNKECLQHTWYLAIDIQLHIVSPLVLFWALSDRRVYGWTGLSLGLLASFTASTIFCFLVVVGPDVDFWSVFYVNTLTRAPVFFVGMMYGYLLHVCRKQRVKLPMWFVLLLWICSLVLMGAMLYLSYVQRTRPELPDWFHSLVYSFQRPLWAVGLGWIVFACAHGYGGPINWFLSLTVWKFIARISYAMYIYHYPMQFVFIGSATNTIHFSLKHLFLFFFKDLAVTLVLSIFGTVVIDAPFQTMVNLALAPKAKVPPVTENKETKENKEETVQTKDQNMKNE